MIERRFATATVQGRKLTGLAAPFNTETRISDFRERIAPGAFRATLASGRDVICCADHDVTRVLGRTKSGTLHLEERSDGLHFVVELPDTTLGRDLLALAERGDLGGVSIGFRAVEDTWEGDLRELRQVELVEISIVSAHAAYPTTVEARSLRPFDRNRAWLETIC